MMKAPPQLYLVIEPDDSAAARLAAALDAAPVSAVLITAPDNRPLDAALARPLVELAQKKSVAVLIEDDASLARALRADGVHLNWSITLAADFAEAREILGNRYMIGVDALSSKHDAMEMAEAGADYIAFSVAASDDETANTRFELLEWWAEIFETPCVALGAADADDARALAGIGVDFVGHTLAPATTPAAISDTIRAMSWSVSQARV